MIEHTIDDPQKPDSITLIVPTEGVPPITEDRTFVFEGHTFTIKAADCVEVKELYMTGDPLAFSVNADGSGESISYLSGDWYKCGMINCPKVVKNNNVCQSHSNLLKFNDNQSWRIGDIKQNQNDKVEF